MTLIEQIKTASLVARKARETDIASSLTTLLGEIETLAKAGKGELTDAVVITIVKKFIKNIDETIKAIDGRGNHSAVGRLHDEKVMYQQFLPKQLTTDELEVLIDSFIAGGVNNVGDAMKRLKVDHAGTYDGAIASRILKARYT